jgi:hypothetical protein
VRPGDRVGCRPLGGATVVFDASPTDVETDRIPTLLPFDAGLQPDGGAGRATDLAEGAESQAVTAARAIPDGGGAGPLRAPAGRPRARAGALIIGACDTPREDTQLLWLAGP